VRAGKHPSFFRDASEFAVAQKCYLIADRVSTWSSLHVLQQKKSTAEVTEALGKMGYLMVGELGVREGEADSVDNVVQGVLDASQDPS
jgi:hypothetical protein